MKKNVIILSLLVFFAVGMVAQAPSKDAKECTKTEVKADCNKEKKSACCPEKKADANCSADAKAKKKAACSPEEAKQAEKKGCCPTAKS